ncbi:transcriptional regulator with XRE-family HTH domain [Streptomyces olivoverticillatus]|uniref:Transcriptional regulator with XRE-family HTH domain n=1 Tax=Streptomyces olivoverticillatus TaxID=66427 RepID=A0A7W7LQ07_9ACTN|nr:helix-turn-helix transcriptional regulator [Streptomyces olivoverticillatus]MBB4894339.1 transcriptional regulator with XRE-family HTH domain [Streptomyces olivoverticillatus]
MTGEAAQPPMAWRYCGNQLKLWRLRAGVSREELGKEAGYGYDAVKSMEQGRRRPTVRLLEIADEMCEAHGLLLAARDYLTPERFPSFSLDFIRYEAEAIALSSFQPLLIPGLLQTEEYARELIGAHWPPLDDEAIEEMVAARLERQALLDKQARAFSFVIGEGPLRQALSGTAAHKRQLHHLMETGERRNVTIQVLPNGGAHAGLNGPLVLLETQEHEHIAYEEGQTTGVLYTDAEKISIATQRHVMISRQSLSPSESASFISKLAEAL